MDCVFFNNHLSLLAILNTFDIVYPFLGCFDNVSDQKQPIL